jgi:hypothetical protein
MKVLFAYETMFPSFDVRLLCSMSPEIPDVFDPKLCRTAIPIARSP